MKSDSELNTDDNIRKRMFSSNKICSISKVPQSKRHLITPNKCIQKLKPIKMVNLVRLCYKMRMKKESTGVVIWRWNNGVLGVDMLMKT